MPYPKLRHCLIAQLLALKVLGNQWTLGLVMLTMVNPQAVMTCAAEARARVWVRIVLAVPLTTGEVTGNTTGSLELTRSQLVDSLRKSEWYLSLEGNDRRTVMGAIIEGLVSRKHFRK